MPPKEISAEAKLRKLGERIRQSIDMMPPADEIRREQLREYIRDEWEQEQKAKRTKAIKPLTPTKEREPEEPEP